MYRTAFPDVQMTIEGMIAEGDAVAFHHTFRDTHKGELVCIPPTGKQVNVTGIDIIRIRGGRIMEQWTNADDLGAMHQLGVVPRHRYHNSGSAASIVLPVVCGFGKSHLIADVYTEQFELR